MILVVLFAMVAMMAAVLLAVLVAGAIAGASSGAAIDGVLAGVRYHPPVPTGKHDPHAGQQAATRGLLVTLGVLGALVGGLAGIGLAVALLLFVVATS
jgi:hypothetical protein